MRGHPLHYGRNGDNKLCRGRRLSQISGDIQSPHVRRKPRLLDHRHSHETLALRP